MTYLTSHPDHSTSCLIKEACCGNDAAQRVCEAIIFYTDLFDNAVDKDATIDLEHAGIVWINVLTTLSFNPFWEQHKVALAPLLTQGMSAWLDSEICSKHSDVRVRQAGDILKSFYLEFLFHVGCICGGYQHMRQLSKKWRGFDFDVQPTPYPQWERAIEPKVWAFPKDHGAHLTYKTEWWYFSGTLNDTISYHVCFFRHADKRFAHASFINHVTGEKRSFHVYPTIAEFYHGLSIRYDDWKVAQHAPDRFELSLGDILKLDFKVNSPYQLHGIKGLSSKGSNDGEASHYYSYTDLRTSGSLAGEPVNGTTWFDHEFCTDAMPEDVVGWDWFALRSLSGDKTVMIYLMRRADGSYTSSSRACVTVKPGTTAAEGGGVYFMDEIFVDCPPYTGYPTSFRITIGSEEYHIKAMSEDQEFVSPDAAYYEGGVTCSGAMIGTGHMELTGYRSPVRF